MWGLREGAPEEIMIKSSIIEGLKRYVEQHSPTGSFLRAVLSNDLKESCFRADDDNLLALPEIVKYCYNELPTCCWGSPERVETWLAAPKETLVNSGGMGKVIPTISDQTTDQYIAAIRGREVKP
jgi:hypothetical protein